MQEKYLKWIFEELEKRSKTKERDDESTIKSINKCIEENKKKISNLLDMKIKEMISDDEYWEKRNDIMQENKDLQSKLVRNTNDDDKWVELTRDTFNFITYSRIWLKKGGKEERKKILMGLCSNPKLKDKKLLVLQQKQLEIIKVITQPFRGPDGVFEPFKIVYIKPKTTPRGAVLSLKQGLVDAVATYFQGIEPGSVYVPKCDKDRFE